MDSVSERNPTPRTQTTHDLDQVRQGTPEAIKLPYDQDVPRAEELQAYLEPRPVVTGSRCLILMDVSFIDPGSQQRIALQVGALPIIGGRNFYIVSVTVSDGTTFSASSEPSRNRRRFVHGSTNIAGSNACSKR